MCSLPDCAGLCRRDLVPSVPASRLLGWELRDGGGSGAGEARTIPRGHQMHLVPAGSTWAPSGSPPMNPGISPLDPPRRPIGTLGTRATAHLPPLCPGSLAQLLRVTASGSMELRADKLRAVQKATLCRQGRCDLEWQCHLQERRGKAVGSDRLCGVREQTCLRIVPQGGARSAAQVEPQGPRNLRSHSR